MNQSVYFSIVSFEILYGTLRLLRSCVIFNEEKMAPSLTPARPKACITIRFGHSVTRLEFFGAKSMYPLLMTTTPLQVRFSRTCSISDLAIEFPVGFPRVVMNTTLMDESADRALQITTGQRAKLLALSKGIVTMLKSFTRALFAYIP